MNITNLTPDNCTLTVKDIAGRQEYWFDFGAVKKDNPSTFIAKVENVTAKSIKPGCMSCTTARAKQIENDVEVKATYDSKTKGKFSKTVVLTLTDGKQVKFILNGTVV